MQPTANALLATPAADVVIWASIAFGLFTTGLFTHRWLGKVAGHPVGPSPTVKHIP